MVVIKQNLNNYCWDFIIHVKHSILSDKSFTYKNDVRTRFRMKILYNFDNLNILINFN